MKVCTRCNSAYPDNVNNCIRCGNQNLVYYQNNNAATNPAAVRQGPKSFAFGKFFVDYFKSPTKAKNDMINRKDFGSALILNGITLFVYFILTLCTEGGMIETVTPLVALLLPITLFIIVFGFQYLDILLYSLYSRSRSGKRDMKVGFSSYIYASTNNRLIFFFSSIIIAIFALALNGTGISLIAIVLIVDYLSIADAKLKLGIKPTTLLDNFMFALTGTLSILFTAGFSALFIALFAANDISRAANNFLGSLF